MIYIFYVDEKKFQSCIGIQDGLHDMVTNFKIMEEEVYMFRMSICFIRRFCCGYSQITENATFNPPKT